MGNGVEGEVIVDQLPEIGVGRRYQGFLGIGSGWGSVSFGTIMSPASSSRSCSANLAEGRYRNSLVKRPPVPPQAVRSFSDPTMCRVSVMARTARVQTDWGAPMKCCLLAEPHRRTFVHLSPGTL